jgi:hypothetical protein
VSHAGVLNMSVFRLKIHSLICEAGIPELAGLSMLGPTDSLSASFQQCFVGHRPPAFPPPPPIPR